MKKIIVLLPLLLLFLIGNSCFAQLAQTHHANYNLTANPHTKFAQSDDLVFFVNNQNFISGMEKTTWNKMVFGPIPQAQLRSGLLWTNNRLYYVALDNKIHYIYDTGVLLPSYTTWASSGPIGYEADPKSDLAESTNNIYYVDKDRNVRAMGKNSVTSYVMNSSAQKAKPGTDLLWKGGRLYYIAENNKIYYFYYSNGGWQTAGPVGNNLNTNIGNTNLAASTNNLYFIDNDDKIRSMGIGPIGSNWFNAPIVSDGPKAAPQSDLLWHDSKLFYIGDVNIDKNNTYGASDGTYIQYYYYDNSSTSWKYTEFDFIKYVASYDANRELSSPATVGPNANFIEVNDEIIFRAQDDKTYYFRSPIILNPVLNSPTKPGWDLVFQDEFDDGDPAVLTSKWHLQYTGSNHPMETPAVGDPFSAYYNVTDGSGHTHNMEGNTSFLQMESTNVGGPYSEEVQATDANDEINGGLYPFKSAMLSAQKADAGEPQLQNRTRYGYFEIRCRMPFVNNEKFTFWLFGGSNRSQTPTTSSLYSFYEIDVFEVPGDGDYFPTNYHEYFIGGGNTNHSYHIYPVVGQKFCTAGAGDEFYTYGCEWSPEKICFFINNQLVRTIHKDQNYPVVHISDIDMNTIVQPRIWSHARYGGTSNYPNTYDIDYVRIYKKSAQKTTEETAETSDLNQHEINMFPNPTKGVLNFSGLQEPVAIQLVDLTGKVVFRETLSPSHTALEIAELKSGIYFIQSDEKAINGKKVVVLE